MERELYDLSIAQDVLFFSQKFTLSKQVNTIATLLLLEGEVNLELLEKAVTLCYERIDSLTIRLVKDGKKVRQYFNENEIPVIDHLDFTGKTEDQGEEILKKLAKKRVTYIDKPVSKTYIVNNFKNKKGIFFLVSHVALDSWGICIFFKDVLEVYEALKEGKELPKAPVSYKEMLKKELEYKDSPQCIKDEAYWKEQFTPDNEPIYTGINGYEPLEKARKKNKNPNLRSAPAVSFFSKGAHEIQLIPREMVEAMRKFSLEKRVPIQTLVLLAYRSYLSKVNRREKDIMYYTVIARRATLAEKKSGGSRVQFLPFRTILEEDLTFVGALEAISERQSSIYKHANYDPLKCIGMLNSIYGKKQTYGYCSGSLTFQPVPLKGPDGAKIHTKWYGNGAASNAFYLTIMDDDGSGALRCYYEYQSKVISREKVIDFHEYMLKLIDAGIKNPDITIGELLDI